MNELVNMAARYEHEIPEGYEARIEGNKVILEKKESEDESIGKDIIAYMRYERKSTKEEIEKRFIPWLEKQKEPHFTKRNALFDKCVANCAPAVMKEVSDSVDKMLEKEQKPAGWSEDDKKRWKNVLRLITEANDRYVREQSRSPFSSDILWLESLPERFNLQPKLEWSEEEKERIRQNGRLDVCYNPEKYGLCHKAEWSEEDEKMRQHIISDLREFRDCETDEELVSDYEDEICWLKSLRPQPKQEWIEEDEKHLQGCINLMRIALDEKPYPYYEDYLWLKSLRPQPHWKPSEEQMKALSILGRCVVSPELKTLFFDLKKLM